MADFTFMGRLEYNHQLIDDEDSYASPAKATGSDSDRPEFLQDPPEMKKALQRLRRHNSI